MSAGSEARAAGSREHAVGADAGPAGPRVARADPDGVRITRDGAARVLTCVQHVARPIEVVAPFFEAPENLEAITPPWLRFSILTPSPVPMHAGARIDYRLALYGVPLRWRTRIARFEPGRAFVDEQESGPFARWVHTHEFRPEDRADGVRGTWVEDRVEYRAPLWIVGDLAQALFVDALVRRIFEHRRLRIAALLEAR